MLNLSYYFVETFFIGNWKFENLYRKKHVFLTVANACWSQCSFISD